MGFSPQGLAYFYTVVSWNAISDVNITVHKKPSCIMDTFQSCIHKKCGSPFKSERKGLEMLCTNWLLNIPDKPLFLIPN